MPLITTDQTDLIIFDCDGVLVDSEPLSNAVMAEHITRLGWAMNGHESIRLFKGKTMAQVHCAIEDRLGKPIDKKWTSAFHLDQEQRMRRDLTVVAGVNDLIARVQAAGLHSCVASQGSHEKMAISLGLTGLWDQFEGRIFSARDVANPKPAPDLFLHAAIQMNVSPTRCIVIEDSPTGIAGALAAKMRVIGYDPDESGVLAQGGIEIVSRMDAITIV